MRTVCDVVRHFSRVTGRPSEEVSSRYTFSSVPSNRHSQRGAPGVALPSKIKQIIELDKQRPAECAAFDFMGIEEIHGRHA